MKGKSINPESYLTGQVKKIVIFLAFFIGVFYLTSNFAQAEIKEFYIPFEDKEETLGDFIKNNIFNKALGALKNQTYDPGSQVSGEIEDYNPVGAASDYHFSFGPIKDKSQCVYETKDDPHFSPISCDLLAEKESESIFSFFPSFIKKAEARPNNCWKPVCINKNPPYQIIKAELISDSLTATDYTLPRDKQKCEMDIHIVNLVTSCTNVWGSGAVRYSSNGGVCVVNMGGANKYIAEHDDTQIPASKVCAHVRLDANAGANQYVVRWTGTVKITGRLGTFDNFYVIGEDYYTGKDKRVKEGELLEICKGEKVTVAWASSHVYETNLWVGVGNNSPTKFMSAEDKAISYTPSDTTTFFVEVKGTTGDGPKSILSGPISVIPMNCDGESQPWVEIDAKPDFINVGESSTLTWTSGNTTSCRAVGNISDWKGEKPKKGTAVVTTNSTRWYEIECTNGTTDVTDKTRVKVNGLPTGNINVKVRLNGVEVPTPVDLSVDMTGPETINISEAPQTLEVVAGTYNLKYNSGGPENSTFLGFSPGQSIVITANQTSTVYLDFSDGAGRCNITVQALKANCDGTNPLAWTGPLSYALLGPIILNGTAVDQSFENVPAGRYYLTELIGGPGTYNGVDPGNPVACISGATVNVMMKFNDCGTTYSKCNYATGVCTLCPAYSEDCKYTSLTQCNQACAGCADEHKPKADIFCWANYDSDECIGMNDNNPNTPPVILYDKSTDPCGDIKDCFWEIFDYSSGKLLKTSNNCGSYPWYDENPGVYTGKLRVTDSNGDSSTDTQKFTIKNVDALTCNFVWDPDAPTVGGKISFFDQSLTPNGTTLTAWAWTFQDASPASSTAQTVSDVIFNTAGVKSVTIKVKNSAGAVCTLTKEITVKTMNPNWKETIPF
jgi:hypothetical protein